MQIVCNVNVYKKHVSGFFSVKDERSVRDIIKTISVFWQLIIQMCKNAQS